jgi:predicted DNA-binding transcriptional regulator AlpA
MSRSEKILFWRDFDEKKGITWSRKHVGDKINKGEFPPPDGRTTDRSRSPRFWFESTIDRYLKARAQAFAAARKSAADSNPEKDLIEKKAGRS